MTQAASPLAMAVLGVENLERSLAFYLDVTGLSLAERKTASGAAFERHWNLPAGAAADYALLRGEAGPVGQILLMQFNSTNGKRVRSDEQRSIIGLSNINLYVEDVFATTAALKEQGFTLWADPVKPDMGGSDGTTIESTMNGPDGVAVNLIQLSGGDEKSVIGRLRADVASAGRTPTGMTPVATSAHVVKDAEPALAFYGEVLGMINVMDLELASPETNVMLGRPEDGRTRLVLLDAGHVFGKAILSCPLNYEPFDCVPSAAPPNIGYIAQSYFVSDLDAAKAKTISLGGTLFSEPEEIEIPGAGLRRSLVVRCPGSGALIELSEASS